MTPAQWHDDTASAGGAEESWTGQGHEGDEAAIVVQQLATMHIERPWAYQRVLQLPKLARW
jgi:hypothetical protein